MNDDPQRHKIEQLLERVVPVLQVGESARVSSRDQHPLSWKESLTKRTVWLFPQISICLDCGVAQFQVSDAELNRLTECASQDPARQSDLY
jgi:hypothetical protein